MNIYEVFYNDNVVNFTNMQTKMWHPDHWDTEANVNQIQSRNVVLNIPLMFHSHNAF